MSEDRIPVIGRAAWIAGRLHGLELMINHNLEEARGRYQEYLRRHDELANGLLENDRRCAERVETARRDLADALDGQTKSIWMMFIKISLGMVTVLLGALGGITAWLLKAHGWA